MKLIKIIFIFLFAFSLKTEADVVLPRVLGHQMVLQQQKPIVIWGKANVGEQVSVSFANESAQTTTDKNGKWKVVLNPLKASFENRDMTIKGSNTIVLKDILVGEVWLCSGQSNMEWTVGQAENATEEILLPASGIKEKEKAGLSPYERRVLQIKKVKTGEIESYVDRIQKVYGNFTIILTGGDAVFFC